MKVAAIIGARPQFIKAAPVSKALQKAGHTEIMVHTGQHYHYGMSKIFFEELGISEPDINLGVGSGSHGWQTGHMLIHIEEVLLAKEPDWVLVYGDTNSTLAGALAACKLRLPLAHVEAGLRSFNREMPEEHNRVLTDHCSDLLFCPTKTAVDNLAHEGITKGVNLVGDTMYDAVLQFAEIALERSTILQDLKIEPKGYLLATIHRPYNVDHFGGLKEILTAFLEIGKPIVFPVHPRTREKIESLDVMLNKTLSTSNVKMIEPVGYLDMLMLEQNARLILTDSGGMQKEAYFFGVPCVTLRPETEWVETVDAGWNVLVGGNRSLIVQKALSIQPPSARRGMFGDGHASKKILRKLEGTIPTMRLR